jgi:hypothetical protein
VLTAPDINPVDCTPLHTLSLDIKLQMTVQLATEKPSKIEDVYPTKCVEKNVFTGTRRKGKKDTATTIVPPQQQQQHRPVQFLDAASRHHDYGCTLCI